jgi:hypothetical protein
LPPLSPKRNVRREHDLGEACLALSNFRSRSRMRLRKRTVEEFDDVQDFLVGAAHGGAGSKL